MTSDELNDGMQIVIRTAHDLHAALGRIPKACEIRWRAATIFQRRPMSRRDAMTHADRMIHAVTTAAATTKPGGTHGNTETT